MKIASLGAGMIGSTLGRLWHDAGHDVMLSSRHPQAIDAPEGVQRGSVTDAVQWADVVLLAIPLGAVAGLDEAIRAAMAGKVVVDANNAIPNREPEIVRAVAEGEGGSGGWTARQLPGARVVKAFNTVYFKNMEAAAAGERAIGVPVAADDEEALAIAEQLVRDAGMEPVRVGPLHTSGRFDFGTPVWNSAESAQGVRRILEG